MTLSIILPTYNEAGNIISLIEEILHVFHALPYRIEIFVVDDDSPDGTAFRVSKAFAKHPSVFVIVRKNEKGLASAIDEGIRQSKGGIVAVMDTDFNHDPVVLPSMVTLLKRNQLVIGSRYVPGGGMENRVRYVGSFLFNRFLRMLLGISVYDSLSGFFVIRRNDLLRLPTPEIFYGFGDYFMRLIYWSQKQCYTMCETPVFYKNRTSGRSKSRLFSMVLTYTYSAIRLRTRTKITFIKSRKICG